MLHRFPFEEIFMANANTVNEVVNLAAQTINATAETAVAGASVAVPTSYPFPSFKLRLAGTAAGGTAATLQFKLYLGAAVTGTALGSFTVTGAAVPAAGGNFSLTADLTWDVVSGKLTGTIGGQTNGTVTATGAITTATAATQNLLVFGVSATFGAALATNSVKVAEFTVEQV